MLEDQDLEDVLDQLKKLRKISKPLQDNIDWSNLNDNIPWQSDLGYLPAHLLDVVWNIDNVIEKLEVESRKRTKKNTFPLDKDHIKILNFLPKLENTFEDIEDLVDILREKEWWSKKYEPWKEHLEKHCLSSRGMEAKCWLQDVISFIKKQKKETEKEEEEEEEEEETKN